MFSINLAIKFGSNEIIIYRKGFGIIAKEPAYLAVIEHDNKLKVKATGKEAEKMFEVMKKALPEVKNIKFTNKLKNHPVCLSTEGNISLEMEKLMM